MSAITAPARTDEHAMRTAAVDRANAAMDELAAVLPHLCLMQRAALWGDLRRLAVRLAEVQVAARLYGRHPLAAVRAERGMSYQALARAVAKVAREQLGVFNMAAERQKIWRWENKGVVPDPLSQRALAVLLGVPVSAMTAEPWPAWLRHAVGAEAAAVAS